MASRRPVLQAGISPSRPQRAAHPNPRQGEAQAHPFKGPSVHNRNVGLSQHHTRPLLPATAGCEVEGTCLSTVSGNSRTRGSQVRERQPGRWRQCAVSTTPVLGQLCPLHIHQDSRPGRHLLPQEWSCPAWPVIHRARGSCVSIGSCCPETQPCPGLLLTWGGGAGARVPAVQGLCTELPPASLLFLRQGLATSPGWV